MSLVQCVPTGRMGIIEKYNFPSFVCISSLRVQYCIIIGYKEYVDLFVWLPSFLDAWLLK